MQNQSFPETELLAERITDIKTNIELLPEVASQVIMHCFHYGCDSECGKTIRCEIKLHPGMQLVPVEGGEPSTLLHTYKIKLPPAKNYKMDYCTEFTLVFSGLPKHCKSFHFIEPDDSISQGWVIRNIKRSATDVYKLTLSNHASWEGEVDF